VPFKEEKESDFDKWRTRDTVPANPQRVRAKASPLKKKEDQSALTNLVSESRASKPGRASAPDSSAAAENKDTGIQKRKPKSSVPKVRSADGFTDGVCPVVLWSPAFFVGSFGK